MIHRIEWAVCLQRSYSQSGPRRQNEKEKKSHKKEELRES